MRDYIPVNQALKNRLKEYLFVPARNSKNWGLNRIMYRLITVISDVLKVSASLFGTELFVVSMRSSRYFIKSY